MFGSSLVWLSRSPGPSSHVQQWILLVVMVTLLEMAFSKAPPKDLCLEDPANFAHQMHTIGSVDGRLWTITKDNWTAYELVPCQQNLNHSCMVVSSPVAIDTKWPKLAESVMSVAGTKDFVFTVDNLAIMNSSSFERSVLTMNFNQTVFGFVFGDYHSYSININSEDISKQIGLWISSDVKDKAYRLLDSGKQVTQFGITKDIDDDSLMINEILNSDMSICNVTQQDGGKLEVQFIKAVSCDRDMDWTVQKGVHYRDQFYFFASDKVYFFSDKAQTSPTSVETASYVEFFHCHKPTTLATSPPPISSSPSDAVTTDTLDPFAGQKQGLMIVFLMGAVPIGLVISLCLFSITMDALEARSIRNKCTSSMHGRKGSKGHRASTRKNKQESRQQQPKVNRSKAKTSMGGSKVSMNKVSLVAKPQAKAKRRHAGR